MTFSLQTTFSNEEVSRMVPHLFLPRKLPGLTTQHLAQDEAQLLRLMRDCITETHKAANNEYLHQAEKVFNTWTRLQSQNVLDADLISTQISTLAPGDAFALYIREQNCGFLLSVPNDQSHDAGIPILSTFPASQKSVDVMSHDGDISCTFPSSSIHIPISDFLHSKTFARQLMDFDLRQYELALPKSHRLGSTQTEIRDVADPLLMSQLITASLTDRKSDICHHFAQIHKTIRDHVSWYDSLLPFRRSGLWATAKVVLQLCLVNTYGKSDGTFLYKLIILRLLACICERSSHVTSDVRSQMLTKLARRICKLEKYTEPVSKRFADMYSYLRTLVIEVMKLARHDLETRWKKIADSDSSKPALPELNGLNFKADTKQTQCTAKVLDHLQKSRLSSSRSDGYVSFPPRYRVCHTEPFPLSHFQIEGEENCGIALWDFEQFVLNGLDNYACVNNCQYIRQLFEKYIRCGKTFYMKDPLGGSRMILISLKILQVLEQIVMDKHSILGEHQSGVDIRIMQDLLLPQDSDMKLAYELETHYTNRNKTQFPSLIQEEKVSKVSFGARFAHQNYPMLKKLQEIIEYSEEQIRIKLEEVRNARQRCLNLRRQADVTPHQYNTVVDEYGFKQQSHSASCAKCSLINQAEHIQVDVYERPLPPAQNEQLAVVFELLIPTEIACLRDALYFFANEVCFMIKQSSTRILQSWIKYSELARHHSGHQDYLQLGSTIKAFNSTHYRSHHPEKYSDDDFIVENGLNCYYEVNSYCLKKPLAADIKKYCTYDTDHDVKYKCLSWTVKDTHHTQNEVMAKQNTCHEDMTLTEFNDFGSLRAGHHLQLRNIYRCLQQNTLSFHNEPVLCLVCQAVWQAGPQPSPTRITRESHQDLLDSEFTAQMLILLEKILQEQSENWMNYYIILNVIVLTTRILTFSPSKNVEVRALNLLLQCRQVTNEWALKVEAVLSKMAEGSKEKVQDLRQILIFVSVCSALTFWVDPKNVPSVLDGPASVKCWLNAIARIKDNITLNKSAVTKLSTPLRNLLRLVRNTGLALGKHLHVELQKNTAGLQEFAKEHWPGSKTVFMGEWRSCCGANQQVYECKGIDSEENAVTLHMDTVCGNFLVNGYPVGYLPEIITNHSDYQRVFSNTVFEVQPISGQHSKLVTRLKYHKCTYSFSLCNNSLLVIEIQEDGEMYQLIPHNVFTGTIPHLLVRDFSHWWSRSRNSVIFRPKSFSNPRFRLDVKYDLDLSIQVLLNTASSNAVIDINSHSFSQLYNVMKRLEDRNFLLVFHKDEKVEVALPRMGLHFEIDLTDNIRELRPREYPEMKVSKNQKFGTLVGLGKGLLLEALDSTLNINQILLVPHGKVQIHPKEGHQLVDIKLEELRKPEFFAIDVDAHLRQLRAGQSHVCWLFLAYLHAATSSPLPDELTGLTGTESALRLLNSPQCWSCQPLDKEAMLILEEIASLSPKRQYYPPNPKCMEKVQWPQGVDSVCAHDSYRETVTSLIEDSKRLEFLYPSERKEKQSWEEVEPVLVSKAFWHHRTVCPELGKGFTKSNGPVQHVPKTTRESTFCTDLDSKTMQSVRTMAHSGHYWLSTIPQAGIGGILTSLLVNGNQSLTGVTGTSFHTLSFSDIIKMNFTNSWLDLYNFGRRVNTNHYKCEWTMLISALAFTNVPLEHLKLLHAVAVNAPRFTNVNPPPYKEYICVSENFFNESTVKSIFKQHAVTFTHYLKQTGEQRRYLETYEDFTVREKKLKLLYDSRVASQVNTLTDVVEDAWPTEQCNSLHHYKHDCPQIKISSAIDQVNDKLTCWYRNRALFLFLQLVERVIQGLPNSPAVILNHKLTQNPTSTRDQTELKKYFEINVYDRMIRGMQISEEFTHVGDTLTQPDKIESLFKTGKLCLTTDQEYSTTTSLHAPGKTNQFPWKISQTCPIGASYMKDTKDSWDVYNNQPRKTTFLPGRTEELIHQLKSTRSCYSTYATIVWRYTQNLMQSLNLSFQVEVLKAAGIFPKLTPVTLLPLICDRRLNGRLRSLIGSTAILWTLEQKASRCVRFAKAGQPKEVSLKNELINQGHENWSPQDKPEWLLLELEMDMMIRPVQVEVAKAMLQPEKNKHAVMQLNMGEGKTAVIIPMVVSQLANGQQLCRVTVLKSLFQINKDALAFKLGGLLNQRVYTFPCRRDMSIGGQEANIMLDLYKECASKRGIVLALPEHRLSFQLKGYEKSRNNMISDASPLLAVQYWLNDNARDVLDESDEILHVKYQLVYTIGAQTPPGGGKLRWIVAQSLLELVPGRLCDIIQKHGADAAECEYHTNRGHSFPPCRLLKQEYYEELCKLLVDDIFEGKLPMAFPDLRAANRQVIYKFLIHATISKQEHDEVLEILNSGINASHCDVLLILRGLLACGVLCLVLSKRWRVNYGVNPKGHRLMAVPFRAKDVAAERTEFGHPDMAILCTILSYYYSGLSETQLDQCFDRLYRQKNCDQEYKIWVTKIPKPHPSIQTLGGINLRDFEQKEKILYPALLKNPAVVNFFLGNVVFPKEAKQFEWKMSCSAWDLCSDAFANPVTGFSGTNDTKLLLPLNIEQKDLPSLLGTNGKVLYNLLLPENNTYNSFPAGVSSIDILKRLVNENIPLLLDVGALMTDLDNKTTATKWLKLTHEEAKEAAIYFDEENKLVVTDRDGRTSKLELSPFRRRMEKCIIYLDDFHTRGTDLPIPRGSKGCVTLGKGVTKDKLVQGCMRMRMLGEGHTVCFWASKEVNSEITRLCHKSKDNVQTRDVLRWAMENSRIATREGFLQWSVSGFNYAKKKTAHFLFESSRNKTADVPKLGERCSDMEVISLKKMYGTFRTEEVYPNIVRSCLHDIKSHFVPSKLGTNESFSAERALVILNEVGAQIVEQCKCFVPTVKRLSYLLDEEQERELEHELEEEWENDRPASATPARHTLSDGVKRFVVEGILPGSDATTWAVKLPLALQKTKLWPTDVQAECWGENIFVSNDFVSVITIWNQKDKADQFLRPPNWVAAVTTNNETTLLLLSPFEANAMMPIFRSGTPAAILHMFAARMCPGQDTLFGRPQLAMPSSNVPFNYWNFDSLYINLALFGGNLYFADKSEQDKYTHFLGYILRPRTGNETYFFDQGLTYNGFVMPDYRPLLPYITSRFQHNPDVLVRGILERRLELVPDNCHINSVIIESRKPFL